jgi:hypothetical protein
MFGSIEIKSRPLRLAYLVDPNDAKQVRKAIQLSSSLWGGTTFPIIPLWKKMPKGWVDKPLKSPPAKSVILGYLSAFDPDVLVQLSKEVPDFVTAAGREVIKGEGIWEDPESKRRGSPRYGIGIFEILQDIFDKSFKYRPKYPLRVVIPKIPSQLALFWAAVLGEVPPSVDKLLMEGDFGEALDIERPAFQTEQWSDLLKGNVLFPRRLTQHDLNILGRASFGRDVNVFFMDASKTGDVIDYWNLRAMGRTVVPAPRQLKDHPQVVEVVTDFLRHSRKPWPHKPDVFDVASIIRSRHSTMDEMEAWAKSLKCARETDNPATPFYMLQHWYPRVWDEWARSKDSAEPADAYGREESIEIAETSERRIRFKPLLPKFANERAHSGEPRCANEVGFRLYGESEFLAEVLPNSSGDNLTRAIGGLTSFKGDWRVGRHGLVKLVKDTFSETRDIPAAADIMFAWLSDMGWTPKLSTAGLLATQMYRQLEGNPQYVLRNQELLGLFEYMSGGPVDKDGCPVAKKKLSAEREVSVEEIKKRIGDSRLYEYLLSKGVFRLGMRVQCPHCRRRSWFPLESVRDSFTCQRCLHSFPAAGNLDTGAWFYKTTGPFSVPGYADGAYAVLLTAMFFDDHTMHSMQTTRVLSLEADTGSEKLEADVACLWQDSYYGDRNDGVLFAECKTYDLFKRDDFNRMRNLAKTFPGAVLVFSTLRKTLTAKEIAGITRIAKAGRKYWKPERPINPVLILTGTELLNFSGPPYCWEEPIKTKFDHFHGLLGLCDASQQIYLNLPSWETEWWEKIEKKRRRRSGTHLVAQDSASPVA